MVPIQPDRARPSLPDLPIELLKTIVQDLKDLAEEEDEDWVLELGALSLVSKALTTPCQEALFEVADMEPQKFRFGKDIYTGSDTLATFPQLINQSPHLASYIRHFTITFPLDPESKLTEEVGDAIAEALEHVTNLTGLSIQHEDETYCKAWVISVPGMRDSMQFGRLGSALAGLLGPRLQHLLLRNVTVTMADLARCTSLEGLHLINAGLDEDPNPIDFEDAGRIKLKTLEITGKTSLTDILEARLIKDRPLFDFSHLEDLTIPLRSGEGLEKQLPEHILPHARRLRSLYLHAAHPYAVSQDDDPPCPNSLTYLNPASFSTLSHLTLSIEFDIADLDAVMRDPYIGHFADRSIRQFEALEALEVEVWIGGTEVRHIDIQQSCGEQWTALDRALAPGLSEEETLLPGLKSVRVLFGMIEDEPDIPPDRVFNDALRRVLRGRFPRLTELNEKGRLEFSLKTEMRFRRF